MAYIVMVVVMAYIVLAYIVMAYVVMARFGPAVGYRQCVFGVCEHARERVCVHASVQACQRASVCVYACAVDGRSVYACRRSLTICVRVCEHASVLACGWRLGGAQSRAVVARFLPA